MEAIADGTMQQHRCYRRVDTTRKSEDHLVISQFLAKSLHGRVDERCRTPCAAAPADAQHEITQQLCAIGRVEHFGVELDAPGLFSLDMISRHTHIVGRSDDLIPRRDIGDSVAMRHPHLSRGGESRHKAIARIHHAQHRATILAARCTLHFATIFVCQ